MDSATPANYEVEQDASYVIRNQDFYFHDTDKPLSHELVGGKAYNLQKIGRINRTPIWFVMPASYFDYFMQKNDLNPLVDRLEDLSQNFAENEDRISSISAQIREKILSAPIDDVLLKHLKNSFENLKGRSSINASFAVRSSGVTEDSHHASYAGLYSSVLNCQNFEDVKNALHKVWASSFSPRAVRERGVTSVSQKNCSMGVIVQELVQASVSGIASSLVLSNNYPGIEIAANYGLGESVVAGEVSPDSWVIHPTKGYVLEQTIGKKEFCITPSKEGKVEKQIVSEEKKAQFTLNKNELKEIAELVKLVKELYQCDVDVEFSLTENREIKILQVRPLVDSTVEMIHFIDENEAMDQSLIAKGLYSVPGIASGKLVYVDSIDELASGKIRLEQGDILATNAATKSWFDYLGPASGLITKEGAPSSHPILLSREKGIPCIIGARADFSALNGKRVTMDGYNKAIYEGSMKTRLGSVEEMKKQFHTIAMTDQPISPIAKEIKTPLSMLVSEIDAKREQRVYALIGKKGKGADLFQGYSLNDARRYLAVQASLLRKLKECSKKAITNENFKSLISLYSDFRSYLFLGEAIHAHSQKKASLIGMQNEIPSYYFSERVKELQNTKQDERSYLTGLPDLKEWLLLSIHFQEMRASSEKFDLQIQKEMHANLAQLGKNFAEKGKLSKMEEIFELSTDKISALLNDESESL